jgi:hypothetical protein
MEKAGHISALGDNVAATSLPCTPLIEIPLARGKNCSRRTRTVEKRDHGACRLREGPLLSNPRLSCCQGRTIPASIGGSMQWDIYYAYFGAIVDRLFLQVVDSGAN